jgi:hypothetical protein
MALLEFPDPGAILNSFKMGALERDELKAILSAMYSSYISGLWGEGAGKWAVWTGAGQGMKDAATAAYLTLRELEKKGLITLTVPTEMMATANLSRFQTETK